MFSINHMPHFSSIYKQSFSLLFFIFTNKPKRNRNSNTIKKLCRQCNNSFYKVGLNYILSYFTFATRLRRQCTICKHKTYLTIRCKMMYHMLYPSIVSITRRWNSKFPSFIFFQLILSPIRKIKWRISHDKICL